jgi:pantoate--beta-alanine ligase
MTAVATLPLARSPDKLRSHVRAWKKDGQRVALVPTMGALHEGHLSLVRLAGESAEHVVASLFVNPTQFAPGEDLERYPRQEAKDQALLLEAGCSLLFAPAADAMYPQGFSTAVAVGGVSDDLEGRFRPEMFGGVATIVAKLLIQTAPDTAIFGEKDFQQLLVIKRMARDLDLPVEILGAPTVREPDGLALSSRNVYLTAGERAVAPRLHAALKTAAAALQDGMPVQAVEARGYAALIEAGFGPVDYFDVRDAETLARLGPGPLGGGNARVFVAARLGKARLIDNWPA